MVRGNRRWDRALLPRPPCVPVSQPATLRLHVVGAADLKIGFSVFDSTSGHHSEQHLSVMTRLPVLDVYPIGLHFNRGNLVCMIRV